MKIAIIGLAALMAVSSPALAQQQQNDNHGWFWSLDRSLADKPLARPYFAASPMPASTAAAPVSQAQTDDKVLAMVVVILWSFAAFIGIVGFGLAVRAGRRWNRRLQAYDRWADRQ